MSNFTFLTEEQCFGRNKLDILKKRGTKAAITDFSVLLGGDISSKNHVNNNDSLEGRTGEYWTNSYQINEDGSIDESNGMYLAKIVDCEGVKSHSIVTERVIGARVALPFSDVSLIPTNGRSGKREKDGILEVEYGYYPQKVASKDMQERLEFEYKSAKVRRTRNSYTTDSELPYYCKEDDIPFISFEPQIHQEYTYRGTRYVRVKANFLYDDYIILSNGEEYKNGDFVWLEVEPVKWLVDEKSHMMITEKIIFSGVQFDKTSEHYRARDFGKTDIKTFMDKYFSRDLEQSRAKTTLGRNIEEIGKTEDFNFKRSRLQKLNPDKTKPSNRAKMTDTEIIQNWIEAGESVLLRGPSGIGKTERIKTLYPDLIYLKLTNNMFPEKIVGSVNLQTGQSIPPDFAKTAIMEGATEEEKKLIEKNIQNIYNIADEVYERSKESNKKVVIMLDELLNVKPAVQGLVYTLVLNRIVEIGKGLKLPDNVVVVATGNQKKYSSIAEDLVAPLEKRFDHILDMEPKVGEWITEYAIPQKIHPAVIGYILSKYNNSNKSEEIQDIGYFYEEPEVGEENLDINGCTGRTNDPRSWTSISNTLYNFERNLEAGKYVGKDVEDIIKRSIGSKLRMEWASEFFDFYNLPTLTPEEVVKGMGKGYTQADLPKDISERFSYMTALITADEGQVEACREFIRKYCDPEYLSIYDIYWAGNDERRMEKISELQSLSLHTSKEAEIYAEDGVAKYTDIGKMYSEHLKAYKEFKETKKEENVRS